MNLPFEEVKAGSFFLVKEYHQLCWWFQKALAMPSPATAESLPCAKGGGKNL